MIVKNDMVIRFFEKIFKFKIAAITLFPFIVISSSTIVDNVLINHEKIHLKQHLIEGQHQALELKLQELELLKH